MPKRPKAADAATATVAGYRFAGHLLDLGARRLYGPDGEIPLEPRPFAVLAELLRQAGQVVSKQQLLDQVWAGRVVSEGVLARAVRGVRAALGQPASDCLRTAHGLGYRFDGEVEVVAGEPIDPFGLETGLAVPGEPAWTLVGRLHAASGLQRWRARDAAGHELDLEFASDAAELAVLHRRAELATQFVAGEDHKAPMPAVVRLRDDRWPAWIAWEAARAGSLPDWAERQGGLAALSPALRLALAVAVAEALARSHALGVLHGRLDADQVLLAADPIDEDQVPSRVWIDGLGHPPPATDGAHGRASAMLRAPECRAGDAPTLGADVYALGVLLLQLLGGDLDCLPLPGWERHIADPLLREDIAAALEPDPKLRLCDAAELARRLRNLERRRAEVLARQQVQAQLAAARRSARRLHVALAAACAGLLVLSGLLAAGLLLHQRASDALVLAEARAAEAEAIRQFVTYELLREASPYRSSSHGESLVGALQRAAPLIGERFGDRPRVAAELERWTGDLLLDLDQYTLAGQLLTSAAERYRQLDGPLHTRTLWTRYQLAISQQRAGQLGRARQQLAELAEQAQALWPDSHMAVRMRRSLAELELRRGEREAAWPLLESLRALPEPAWQQLPAGERLRLARLLLDLHLDAGETAAALALLASLDAGDHGPLAENSVDALHLARARSELDWQLGGGTEALQAAATACEALARRFGPAHHETVEAVLRYAALSQRARQPALAEAMLRNTLRQTPEDDWRGEALRKALDARPATLR